MLNFLIKTIIFILVLTKISFAEIIDKIQVTGNQRISNDTILVLGDIKIGQNYSDTQLNNSLKKLYETNFFSSIDLLVDNGLLKINLIENPIIEKINITGIKKKTFVEKIYENISLKDRMSFTEYQYEKDLILINNILKTNGYYFTKISSSKNINSDLNTINLRINIDLGEKAKIKKIIFLGEKIFKEKRLKEVIASEEHKFWKFISNNVYINQELINLDKRLLVSYFKNNGFYDVKVENSFVEFDKNSN